jgi:hypothetical protein
MGEGVLMHACMHACAQHNELASPNIASTAKEFFEDISYKQGEHMKMPRVTVIYDISHP